MLLSSMVKRGCAPWGWGGVGDVDVLGLVCTSPIGGDHELFSERERKRGARELSRRIRGVQETSMARWNRGHEQQREGRLSSCGDHGRDVTEGVD
jgi:hypothetical protein